MSKVLFDLSKTSGDLKFEQLSLNHDRDDVWMEETWRNPSNGDDEKHANQRTFVTCNFDMENPSNWLFTSPFDVLDANRVYLELLFNTRDCEPTMSVTCKETFLVYMKQYKSQESIEKKIVKSSFKNSKKSWQNIGRLARKNLNMTRETIGIPLEEGTKFIRFAFEEQGICLSLLNIRVYYRVCEEFVDKLVSFDRHVTGKHDSDLHYLQGSCVKNAIPSIPGVELKALCMSNGRPMLTSGECECKGGFIMRNDTRGGPRCEPCPSGTFRAEGSKQGCRTCPSNTLSNSGQDKCYCKPGFYRIDETHGACHSAPSKPLNLVHSAITATSARLTWEEPVNRGGRKEIWYEVKCLKNINCDSVIITPSEKKLSTRYVQINGLKPSSEYTFLVVAKNLISEYTPDPDSQNAVIDFTTKAMDEDVKPVSNLRIDAAQKDGLTISWSVIDSNLNDFEVEVRPAIAKRRSFETRHINTTYATFIGLKDDVVYKFRVRVRDDLRWSDSISYQLGRGQIHTPESVNVDIGDSAFWNQAGSALLLVIAGILIIIAIALCMIVMQRRSKNRKQMSDLDVLDTYKQDSMTPDYHTTSRHLNSSGVPTNLHEQLRSSTKLNAPLIPSFGSPISQPPPYYGGTQAASGKYKTYVDPTTYEDPYQALIEFTFDIDPRDVFITQVIGGGEFGDVCLGGLSRSSQAASRGSNTMNRMFENDQYETVAIKTLKAGSGAKAKAEFLTEASIMGQFSHPNVIRLIGVVTSSEPVMIVTEYMANGSLDQFLRHHDANGEKLEWSKISEMLYAIASGMKYLTDMGYVHRDLAARNVLVDSELRCKIADFGLSRGVRNEGSIEPEYTTNGGKIPVRWTAPEAITHRKFTTSSDVWSFGVVIWEACSYGERPYWDWTNQKVISEIMNGYRLPPPMDCPMGLYRISQWCWKMERHERPTFTQLVAMLHKFVLQPTLIENDPGELPKRIMSTINLSSYGAIAVPTPPQSAPPMPSLDEFLRSIGLNHVYGTLVSNNVHNLSDLAQMSPLDLLACGLISQECSVIRDGLNGRLTPPSSAGSVHTTTRGTRTINPNSSTMRRDEGFFV
ncbi:unnamed protein product [Caenorhabditis bovis]|uniref:receptor protein-tyrosine kinase n=1 Tax=Caenorhabditis bovis TaxID=2654633 RepID=A0A8S1ERX0_9PELO|nr:unnamed protein product [Caenorhabditis bovis]